MDLELDAVPATLEEVKIKTRRDADGKVSCAELVVSSALESQVLDFFDPTLRAWLFDESRHDPMGGHPVRDTNMMFPLRRGEEMGGAIVKVGFGLKSVIELPYSTLDEFRITPQAGSGVVLVCRIRCQPSKAQIGDLYMLIEQPITLSVQPSQMALEAA